MGKGDRRGKAKRSQRAFETAVSLSPVPKAKRRGRKRMEQLRRNPNEYERAPEKVALQARARKMGKDQSDWNAMRAQSHGEDAGRALAMAHDGDDLARLWSAYKGLTQAEERYARVVLGKSLCAKVAKIEMMPERVEADPDHVPDLRDDDEKHRAAVNEWMRWRGYLGQLLSVDQNAIMAVVRGRNEPLTPDGLTPSGKQFVAAMENFSNIVDRANGTR